MPTTRPASATRRRRDAAVRSARSHILIVVKIVGIHHITLAVRDLNAAAQTFSRIFGARADHVDRVPVFGVRTVDLALGDSTFQLAAAEDRDNPLARFLERKGEGFYNLAIEVDRLDEALRELQSAGIRLSQPVESAPGLRSAFIAMASTHGLSIQLVEKVGLVAAPARPSANDRESEVEAPVNQWPARPQPSAPGDRSTEAAAHGTKLLDLTPDEWSDTE